MKSVRIITLRIATMVIISLVSMVLILCYLIDFSNTKDRDNICIDLGKGEYEMGCWLGDTLHFFLPSYIDIQNLKVNEQETNKFNIENLSKSINRLNLDTSYHLYINDSIKSIRFHKSENIPALFIHTQSSGTNIIHKSKEFTELITTKLVLSDGTIQYMSQNDTINSRGNTSWNTDKKPYMISLSIPHELLNMPKASKWILLASSGDLTCLRNKIVYDFSAKMDFEWSPKCEFVEVYLNNEYRGLYLLTEKIEIAANRLQARKNSMNFLCTMDLLGRCQNRKNKEIVTSVGQGIRIRYPYICTPNEYNFISSLIHQFDELMMQRDSSDIYNNESIELMDLDSWARKYLVDEIFGNFDAGLASNFFYCHKDDKGVYKLYGGPIWDYDGSLNLNTVLPAANSFLTRRAWRSVSENSRTPWYNAMYKNSKFNQRVRELYFNEFRPTLASLTDTASESFIPRMYGDYAKGIINNNLRWREQLSSDYTQSAGVKTIDDIIHYLQIKMDFLDSAWSEKNEYCLVQIEHTHVGEYYCYSVKKGDHFIIPFDTINNSWIIRNTGQIYCDTTIITDDTQLLVHAKVNPSSPARNDSAVATVASLPSDGRIIVIGISFILFALLGVFLFYKYRQNRN